ncbi:MAG TPA: glycosyltransferase family 4 protein [Solirubrobacteraceae bacterium]|jgi:UDP-glucose:(heptosyl)LPS alpha-1,3-glucosyltransferase|nr:glycosyltransferase family 4 protein [Solirubrobacteraceae bacterium]
MSADPDPAPAGEVTIVAHDIGAVGGMERVLAELVLGLRALGRPVTVIARTCELPRDAGVAFHRVPGPRRPALLAYPWFMFAGSLMLRRHRRGVVQATGAIVLGGVEAIAVHYLHQAGPVTPSRSSPLYRLHASLVSRMLRIAERLCYGRAARSKTTFVGVSEGIAAEVREHFPQLAERVISIHNGVDTEVFDPRRNAVRAAELRAHLQVESARLVAVFVGSEWERKGLEPLIGALAAAPEWDLVVAGAGDRRHYERLAEKLGVAGSVHWLGVMSDVQVAFALGETFVLPSSYETFSLVTYEAAASGLALLATPVSGVVELIEQGRNGYLIGRDPEQIASRLRELAADPALRERMGQAARESALRFSWQAMVAKYDRLYSRLQRS